MDWLQLGDSNVTFTINGKTYEVGSDVSPETSLNTYIREYANLKGTKFMCKEGGCGACIVTFTAQDHATGKDRSYAVNSCLVPVLSCHGAAITTIEGIGNKRKGYHKVQKALYTFNGTQCGYCSPGQVMNMYSLLQSNPKIKMEEVENSFGGVICRCTGYRPILDAFKSLASDATEDLKDKLGDIEDLVKKCNINCKKQCKKECHDKDEDDDGEDYSRFFLETSMAPKNLRLTLKSGGTWYHVSQVSEIFQLFDLIGDASYMIVGGNTARGNSDRKIPEILSITCTTPVFLVHTIGAGVYKPKSTEHLKLITYIDVSNVAQLRTATVNKDWISIGGNMTLSDIKSLLDRVSTENELFFGFAKGLADHIDLVANVSVRNRATLGGNLMVKHEHREFPSDIFLILETCGAKITIRDATGQDSEMKLTEFLDTDMNKKLILNVILYGKSSKHYVYRSFKIMSRRQNTHANVNAGFLFRIERSNKCIVEERPSIVFGHIKPNFVHANSTEEYLIGKSLLDPSVLEGAKNTLAKEIEPDEESGEEPCASYRKKLAIALFYKFILGVNGNDATIKNRSGGLDLIRPLSSGKQEIPSSHRESPAHLPKLKVEGLIQCSGEAEFVGDMPNLPGQLHGALVLADKARAKILSIDASPAYKLSGVVAFFSAKDIPGTNSYTVIELIFTFEDVELFCSGETKYAGQPIGIIVAKTQELADKAAELVKINYSAVAKPLITIKDVLDSGDKSRVSLKSHMFPFAIPGISFHKIKGEFEMGSQYHYTMELQSSVCIPKVDGMDVYTTTQWMSNVQTAVARVLDTQLNSIDVRVTRLGGAYGSKISNNTLVACACALAAHKLQTPVRTVVNLETNTKALGKRCRFLLKYEAGVDLKGKIQYLKADLYEDMGCAFTDSVIIFTLGGVKNCYNVSRWSINFYLVKTDISSSTWARAPGTLEGMAAIEHIMEHIAVVCKADPLSVRRANFSLLSYKMVEDVLDEAIKTSDYDNRLSSIDKYNSQNRWRKRGISVMPMKYDLIFFPGHYSTVSIFVKDGTVAISTGGVEMGQGINTKVIQVCAYMLGIDMSMIKIKPCYSVSSPNNSPTAGSVGTDSITYATMKCCEELNKKLLPLKIALLNPKWEDLLKAAFIAGIDLKASYMFSLTDSVTKLYSVYGATVLEVEVDLLTGQYQILRTDIVEDAGESLNPLLDIGQIEGAFVMGLGYLSSEKVVYDSYDGALLTTRTWNYWPPGAKDIPIDLRVTIKKKASNPLGVLRSKATGEPPLCMSLTLINALRHALASARNDAGLEHEFFRFDPPCTFEHIFATAGTSIDQFVL